MRYENHREGLELLWGFTVASPQISAGPPPTRLHRDSVHPQLLNTALTVGKGLAVGECSSHWNPLLGAMPTNNHMVSFGDMCLSSSVYGSRKLLCQNVCFYHTKRIIPKRFHDRLLIGSQIKASSFLNGKGFKNFTKYSVVTSTQ